MKKLFTTIMIGTLFISILTGCKQENTASLIAKDLDNNLNKLEVAVTRLDSIDNKYLANPDIYSSLTSTTDTNEGKYFALAFNEIDTQQTITTDNVKQILIDKITDKLTQQNTIFNSTCKKYCDNNGNCYYTDCNGNNYCYESNGNCYNCDTIPTTCSYVGETNLECIDTNIYNDNNVVATQLTQTTDSGNIDSDSSNNNSIADNNINTNSDSVSNNVDTNVLPTPPQPKVKVFYFTQDSFSPIKLRYNPRYISQYNEATINDQIESYLYKVQKLYAMSEDSIEANTILQNCKQNIIDCVKEIKELNDCIINGQCEPNVQQLQALNNYIIDIKTTTSRLKDCNGELSKEINKISESNNNAMINSVDVMNSNYMRLLNHIDTRVTYHKSAIATLEQIKYLLENSVNGNEISDEEIESIIEDFTIQENQVDTNNGDNVENNIKVENSTDLTNTEEIPTPNNSDEYSTPPDNDTQTENINNNDYNSEEELVNSDSISDNEELNNININDSEITDENIETTDETYMEDNETNEANTTNDTLIDTYKETNSWSNIDTYKSNENIESNNEIIDEDIDNIDNNNTIDDNTQENINSTNNVINDSTSSNLIEENTSQNIDNNIADNNITNTTPITDDNINSGIYQNSVITQNNLNNDNGYGGYYYTNDGEIKNNGMNNDGEIGNNGETIENNLNSKNNVNTYGYNTMLDIINQGTVNNGINTL